MTTRSARLALCALVAVLGCAPADAELPAWTLRETLRIGEGDEGPTSFAWIKGIAADDRGRIFIYEHSTQDIRVFGPDGAHVQTIGRRGAGPGELRNAEGIVIAADGQLWVRDAANARFSIFTTDGAFVNAWPARFCWSQGTWDPRVAPERILDRDCVPRVGAASGSGPQYIVVGYRLDQTGVDTLGAVAACGSRALSESATWITREGTSTTYRPIPYAPRSHSVVGPSGETWCANNSATYDLLRIGVDGDTIRVTRTIPAHPVTQAERDSIIAEIELRGPTGLDFSRIPQTKPMIERLTVDDVGRVWVRRSDASGGVVFDLISRDGELIATVQLGRYHSATHSPFVVRGDDVYLVLVDEDDVPQVGRFRLER